MVPKEYGDIVTAAIIERKMAEGVKHHRVGATAQALPTLYEAYSSNEHCA